MSDIDPVMQSTNAATERASQRLREETAYSRGRRDTFVQLTLAVSKLERRGVITTDPERATHCCGVTRDEDGFCRHRYNHPIYVELSEGGAG